MKSKFLVLTVITLLTVFPLSLSAQRGGDDEAVAIETLTAGEGENKIIATGYGMTHDEAEQDALRNAVSEAVGSVVSSTTRIENDEIISDEILSLSHGFVRAHKAISSAGNANDGFEVTVVAIVARTQLIETLTTRGVKVSYDTGGIFAKYNEWDRLKQDELAMVNKFFGPEAIERRSSNVYNYEIRTYEPLRQGDYYRVALDVIATENSNYQVEFDYFKAVLAELSYEVAPLTFLMPTIHLEEGLPEAMRYTLKFPNGVNRKGRTKFKTQLLDICEIEGPSKREVITPGKAYRSGCSTTFYTRFLCTDESYLTTQLLYGKFNKALTTQDLSRLNDSDIRREGVVFDIFQRSYTPYVFVLVEEANMLTPYRRITYYKFTNPESLEVVKNYLTWMFGELHCDIVWQTTDGEIMESFGTGSDCVYEVVDDYSARLRGNSNIEMYYDGYAFMRPVVVPVMFEHSYEFRFTPEEFGKIRNIELVPHRSVQNLKSVVRK